MKKHSNLFIIIATLSTVALIVSNITAGKQIQVMNYTLPAAMVVFPVTYILSDVISEVYGYKASRYVAWLGFSMNLFAVIVFTIAIKLPYPNFFENQNAFEVVLGNTPRVFIASVISYIVGGWIDDLTFERLRENSQFYSRAFISSAVGEFVDASIFIPLAFYGILQNQVIISMIGVQWGAKVLYEGAILPITGIIANKIRKYEEIA